MIYIVGWIICSVVVYGATFAYFQRHFPLIAEDDKDADRSFAAGFALLGPLALVCIPFLTSFFRHGFKFK